MSSFNIVKISEYQNTFRNESIKSQFDLNIEKIKENFIGDIPIENMDWSIGVITGASGTGKTTIAKEIFKDSYVMGFEYDNKKSVLDNMPKEKSVKEITKIFNSVGFATVWSWLKPYNVLSEGEKMRVNLARAMLENKNKIVFDEFTSVVNREVAKHSSFAIQKAVRKFKKQFIAVTCHNDIINWLEPDWVFDTNKMQFQDKRGLLRRPEIKLDIYECDKSEWEIFRKYHYLNTSLNISAKCFKGMINGENVCFAGILHFPHPKEKKFKRVSRVVVLPDYQGLGIAIKFLNYLGNYYKKLNNRFIITTSLPNLKLNKYDNWVLTSCNRKITHSGLQPKTNYSSSKNKYTMSYEYNPL